MEQDIKKREEEFRKENEKLELKTKELLGKAEDVMKIQECWLEYKFHEDKIPAKELHLPKSVDEMGNKGMIQFYKAKLKKMLDDSNKMQNELRDKNEELKKIQKSLHTTTEEKEKWLLQYNLEKNTNAKLEKQINLNCSKLQVKESEQIALKKHIEELKNALKSANSESNTKDNRLRLLTQENDKMKNALRTLREQEKETKESYMSNIKELSGNIKQIQKHKNELLQGYKRQLQLIDNLKRQKSQIESCKVLEMGEQEFMKILDWKLD